MRRSIGWRLLFVIPGVVTAACTGWATSASVCDIAVPEATVTFVGSATDIDLVSTTVTFQVTDVEATWTSESRPGQPTEPVPFPVAGESVVVNYFSSDDVHMLSVGESYRLVAQTMSIAPVRWSSTARDFFAFSNGGCGAEVTPAATTRADGSSLESPVQNFARRAGGGGYLWQIVGVLVVAGVAAAVLLMSRAKVRARNRADVMAGAGSTTVGTASAEQGMGPP